MEDLIVGRKRIVLDHDRALAIARFAFKTAVIINHMAKREPFFSFEERKRFAASLAIPKRVNMWLAGSVTTSGGRAIPAYTRGTLRDLTIKLYVCTYSVGHLVLQIVSINDLTFPSFEAGGGFEHLAVPFWPMLPPGGFTWPADGFIVSRVQFDQFSERWKAIRILS